MLQATKRLVWPFFQEMQLMYLTELIRGKRTNAFCKHSKWLTRKMSITSQRSMSEVDVAIIIFLLCFNTCTLRSIFREDFVVVHDDAFMNYGFSLKFIRPANLWQNIPFESNTLRNWRRKGTKAFLCGKLWMADKMG